MEAIDFLKNKGITKATCYTDGETYYVSELAKLMEEYAALRQPPVSGLVCHCDKLPDGEIAISSKALQKPYGDLGRTDC